MEQCPELSVTGRLYPARHRAGNRCPLCSLGVLYEIPTKFGAMMGCPRYWTGSPRCAFRSYPQSMLEFRCSDPTCLVHHAVDMGSSSSLPGVHYSSLWDESAIPQGLFTEPSANLALCALPPRPNSQQPRTAPRSKRMGLFQPVNSAPAVDASSLSSLPLAFDPSSVVVSSSLPKKKPRRVPSPSKCG